MLGWRSFREIVFAVAIDATHFVRLSQATCSFFFLYASIGTVKRKI